MSQVWGLVEREGSWKEVGLNSDLMWLVGSVVANNWVVSGGSNKMVHDSMDWRWLLLQEDLLVVHNSGVSVKESPHDSIVVLVSHAISNSESIHVVLLDESVDTEVIIHSLIDGSVSVTIVSSDLLGVDLLTVNWLLVVWQSVVGGETWVHLEHSWV